MNEIPKVEFLKNNKDEIEFEIFTIKSLFSRINKLNPSLDRPHRLEFYLILFITKGTGVHFIDFQPCKYYEGSILFISKGQVHAFEINPEMDGFLILFTDSFLSKNLIHSDVLSLYRLYNYHFYSPILHPEEKGKNNFSNIIGSLYEEYNYTDDFAKEEILRLLLKLLLLKAERIKHNLNKQEKNSDWVIKFGIFRDQLVMHCTETRDAKEYARMINISYKHLNEICKAVTGNTAKKFIDNYVVLEIKRNLATSDISVKELSYELGFDEPTNFVKYFKKHTLQTPSQFKQILTK
ncbi:helix-turn-helix domain-containing protein [candidate division KSB1 bacterium]|nr:helix-turn-helix domain-containing protein [candidate division KSB1 bacterium]MBL7094988.1 helix-turn-helix domain-containing protein [candidate division KSB1 bacterium]